MEASPYPGALFYVVQVTLLPGNDKIQLLTNLLGILDLVVH